MELLERNRWIEVILLSARNSAAEATDVLFHWQCLVKMHSKVRNGGLERSATSIYICSFSYATEGVLFISAQLSTDAVSALRKVRVLIRLWKQPSAQTPT